MEAQYYYDLSSGVEEIYYAAWEMNFTKAYATSERIKIEEPNNLLVYHAENYIDFLRIFLVDDNSIFEQYKKDVKNRLKMIQLGDQSSPYYYYSQAEIYLQWSIVRGKNNESIRAAWDINKANKLLRECKKRHPNFHYADKSLAVIHTMMGSLKGFKKSMIKLFTSLNGTTAMGIEEIDLLYDWALDHQSLWSAEITAIRSMIQGHILKDWKASYRTIQGLKQNEKELPLGSFLIGSIAAKAGLNDEAIYWLTLDHDQHSLTQLDYLAGVALLNRQDEAAAFYLNRFIKEHGGENLLKAAHHKLGWYKFLIEENVDGYLSHLDTILSIENTVTDADHEAMEAAVLVKIPDRNLLKARLLYDGGYYQEAKIEAEKFNPNVHSEVEIIESIYRKARIAHKLGAFQEALSLYAQIIDHPSREEHYFSCNASLQMAQIYYEQAKYSSAQQYADVTLGINPITHKESLHKEAKLLKELIAEDQ